jgi:chemotaxis protein methyltransferase CheR
MKQSAGQATLEKPTFEALAGLAYRESGLNLAPEKLMMVQSRLRHRLRALQIADFETYSNLVCSDDGRNERRFMISALTTNVSHFFREPHHLNHLSEALLPDLKQRIQKGQRIRIWSAGCSNGQEPYSIAMHLLSALPALANSDFRVLATDIDPRVISFADEGLYGDAQLSGVPDAHRKWFARQSEDPEGCHVISETVRNCVAFRELNLLADWPMQHQFDAIFCRNVVIYFDVATQERLWPRFHRALADNGRFFLGHSERIVDPAQFGFRTTGPTAYAKLRTACSTNEPEKGGANGFA